MSPEESSSSHNVCTFSINCSARIIVRQEAVLEVEPAALAAGAGLGVAAEEMQQLARSPAVGTHVLQQHRLKFAPH